MSLQRLVVVALLVGASMVAVLRAQAGRRVCVRLEGPRDSGSRVPGRVTAPVGVAGTLGLAVAWVAIGAAAATVLVLAAAAGPVLARVHERAAARGRRRHQLPAALDRLAAALRSGASLTQALGEVGAALDPPLGPELVGLAREADRGRPVRAVLDDWSAAHDDPGTRLAAAALVLATIVGSAPARAVDGVAATVRERLDLAAERRALATQARTSALVLSAAPVGFAALLVLGDSAASAFLLGTPAGWMCLALGTGLDAVGAWWMARLSRSDHG